MTSWLPILALVGAAAATYQPAKNPSVLVEDKRREILIQYGDSANFAVFSATLRGGFYFDVHVDGNQDGTWGAGHFHESKKGMTEPNDDVGYGSSRGKPCAVFLWWAYPEYGELGLRQESADGVYMQSVCGRAPSKFTVGTTQAANPQFLITTYTIPKSELFGTRTTARVLLEVLDDTGRHGYYSLASPLILKR